MCGRGGPWGAGDTGLPWYPGASLSSVRSPSPDLYVGAPPAWGGGQWERRCLCEQLVVPGGLAGKERGGSSGFEGPAQEDRARSGKQVTLGAWGGVAAAATAPGLPVWLEDGLPSRMDSLQRDLLSPRKPLRQPQSILLRFLLHTPYPVAHFPDRLAVPGRSSILQLLPEAPEGRVQEAWGQGRGAV